MSGLVTRVLAIVVAGFLAFGHPTPASKFVLFPQAARVRVFGAPSSIEIKVDQAHRVLEDYRTPDGRIVISSPAPDGGWLTQSEIDDLRSAVNLTQPPNVVAGCCFPRHAFLFYDASGHYLGYLTVCFECGCAEIKPFTAERYSPNWIHWDKKALARIVQAHNLGPTVPKVAASN